ncbi:MAG: amino acid adenylation domain-containing protein [Hyphomicrobiaceae bacterium]|nr:amino acid adenylation domain-containing protein [Hyphomicrobiaceae bacterium]
MSKTLPVNSSLAAEDRGVRVLPIDQFKSVGKLPASVEKAVWELSAADVLICQGANNEPRWQPGERLSHLFESTCARYGTNAAVITDAETVTYAELDRRANQVARHLIAQGVKPGDRVGLMFEKSVETYVAMIAVLKANAAYVPMDPGFPADRVRYIVGDAGLKLIVSMSSLSEKLAEIGAPHVMLDAERDAISARDGSAVTETEVGTSTDQTCYIIYTSGTTGNPKGVLIEQPSICNFVRVAGEQYGYRPGDRVYQGMTIAFDFSVEETWVPLIVGATLVPARRGPSLIGEDLGNFLHERKVTVVACCPTLLSTIERDLPHLRVLLVGGEACPQHLVTRWYREGRTILNSYGPTEATVTCMLTELKPDKPVTIGIPLRTYSIVVLDGETDTVIKRGGLGEICVAGIGLAKGYLNQDELTRAKFIPDFIGIPNNPSGRIYRTGDLGRINDDGEVEYLGRIDTQVKIRGYRIELTEIESVLMEIPGIAQATVSTYEAEPGMPELVAYYALKQDATDLQGREIAQVLRSRLPAYMVPAYFEELDSIPMSVSNKADRKKLPPPQGNRHTSNDNFVAPRSATEHELSTALQATLKLSQVSVEHDFFNDLGANSLLMAQFCSKVRKNPAFAGVSMQDIYLNPTIAKLGDYLDTRALGGAMQQEPVRFHRPSNLSYYGCGALQAAFYAVYGLAFLWLFKEGMTWTNAAAGNIVEHYMRATVFTAAMFFGMSALPIVAKWLLIGKFKEESFPIWSLSYYRFWVVKNLIRSAPMAAFQGRPLLNVYLRLLGAKIGRNAVLEARFLPVATDLFSMGENSVIRKDSTLLGYRAQSNYIYTGPVSIGSNAFIGESSVLDINASMGDRTQLGHASSLQSGQHVPDGKHYHGSPAIETTADYRPIEDVACTSLRRKVWTGLELFALLGVLAPALVVVSSLWYSDMAATAGASASLLSAGVMMALLWSSAAAFFGSLVIGLAAVFFVPRMAQLFLEEGKTYPLFGFHYAMQRIVFTFSNARIFNLLFGDSSFIVPYMRYIGWNLNRVDQTGSNFGTNQRHDNPFMCDIGSGTMVSDGLSMINIHQTASSFSIRKSAIGERNYLGNDIHYPPNGKTGANVLLATKVLVPVDGPVRENVGLLGSPAFEIPRMVDRDREMSEAVDQATRKAAVAKKNVHNLVTMGLYLASRWLFVFATLLVTYLIVSTYETYGILSAFVATNVVFAMSISYFAFIERATLGFGRLKPGIVTIYDREFWGHERHWKLSDSPIVTILGGTPFKNVINRMIGVKVGNKVYDGGSNITERTLTEIGDYATINEGVVLQPHSLEEGVFKSDYIIVGNGCTIGPAAFVHYGTTMGDHSILDADSFLMKGEKLDPCTRWRGNPAKLYQGVDVIDGTETAEPVRAQPEAAAPAPVEVLLAARAA